MNEGEWGSLVMFLIVMAYFVVPEVLPMIFAHREKMAELKRDKDNK